MGENVLLGQVKSFKKGADRSLKAMAEPKLFNRPDIVSTTYTAVPLDGCSVKEGDQFDAHASADGKYVHLAKGHIAIARIEGDGAKLLLDALQEPGSPGILPMKATNVSELSGFIKAVVVGGSGSE